MCQLFFKICLYNTLIKKVIIYGRSDKTVNEKNLFISHKILLKLSINSFKSCKLTALKNIARSNKISDTAIHASITFSYKII